MIKQSIKLLANTKSRTEVGLEAVLSDIGPHTVYGEKKKKEFRPYRPGAEDMLRAYYDDMDVLRIFASENKSLVDEMLVNMCGIKEMGGTLARTENNVLSIVELFEIKSFLLRTRRIAALLEEKISRLPERYRLIDTTRLLDTLDPSGERIDTFYIYDAFSEALGEMRQEKRQLEVEMRKAQKAVRQALEKDCGFRMTPKCELLVPKANKPLLELAESLTQLKRSDEDYMNVVFTLAPNEEMYDIERRMEELNGRIEEEEYRICEKLTKDVAFFRERLEHNCGIIGNIDWDLAKILYANSRDCVRPEIAEEHVIEIEDGRNLVVEGFLKGKGRQYCPVSVRLEDGVCAVTGANMGGKTVSIKMITQIALMTQYAMYVPAKRARIGLSDFVQVLIGDSQNVQRGLSSFGSEMEELREILDNARDRSVIVIDEIASGTNPVEGLALTKSFIKYFSDKPYITIITTHFDHAAVGSHIKNLQVKGLSGVDFDKLGRELTYANRKERIAIIGKYMDYHLVEIEPGSPAPREALNIAKILGVYDEIIDEAKKNLI